MGPSAILAAVLLSSARIIEAKMAPACLNVQAVYNTKFAECMKNFRSSFYHTTHGDPVKEIKAIFKTARLFYRGHDMIDIRLVDPIIFDDDPTAQWSEVNAAYWMKHKTVRKWVTKKPDDVEQVVLFSCKTSTKSRIVGKTEGPGAVCTDSEWRQSMIFWSKKYQTNGAGMTLAHELAHALGVQHDFVGDTERARKGCIRNPRNLMDYLPKADGFYNKWSACSIKDLRKFINNNWVCLESQCKNYDGLKFYPLQ